MPFFPGPGVGGHCIPIDPFYLTYIARKYDYHTRLIELSGEINDSMPEYVVTRVMKALNERGKCLNGAKVVMLGIAYKEDIEDMRESPALKVLEHLEKNLAHVSVVDPYVPEFIWEGKKMKTAQLTEELVEDADMVIITTGHKKAIDYSLVLKKAQLIFDTKNTLGKIGLTGINIICL